MFNRVREAYQEQILPAFKQAPWRRQTQSVAILAVILLVMAVLGGFYLAVASRAGTAGRDLQALEQRKEELIRENDELRAVLAEQRSVVRMAQWAQASGYQPVSPDAVEYLSVKDYPTAPVVETQAISPTPEAPATLEEWLTQTLTVLLSGSGGG
jgi:hypothetical protein